MDGLRFISNTKLITTKKQNTHNNSLKQSNNIKKRKPKPQIKYMNPRQTNNYQTNKIISPSNNNDLIKSTTHNNKQLTKRTTNKINTNNNMTFSYLDLNDNDISNASALMNNFRVRKNVMNYNNTNNNNNNNNNNNILSSSLNVSSKLGKNIIFKSNKIAQKGNDLLKQSKLNDQTWFDLSNGTGMFKKENKNHYMNKRYLSNKTRQKSTYTLCTKDNIVYDNTTALYVRDDKSNEINDSVIQVIIRDMEDNSNSNNNRNNVNDNNINNNNIKVNNKDNKVNVSIKSKSRSFKGLIPIRREDKIKLNKTQMLIEVGFRKDNNEEDDEIKKQMDYYMIRSHRFFMKNKKLYDDGDDDKDKVNEDNQEEELEEDDDLPEIKKMKELYNNTFTNSGNVKGFHSLREPKHMQLDEEDAFGNLFDDFNQYELDKHFDNIYNEDGDEDDFEQDEQQQNKQNTNNEIYPKQTSLKKEEGKDNNNINSNSEDNNNAHITNNNYQTGSSLGSQGDILDDLIIKNHLNLSEISGGDVEGNNDNGGNNHNNNNDEGNKNKIAKTTTLNTNKLNISFSEPNAHKNNQNKNLSDLKRQNFFHLENKLTNKAGIKHHHQQQFPQGMIFTYDTVPFDESSISKDILSIRPMYTMNDLNLKYDTKRDDACKKYQELLKKFLFFDPTTANTDSNILNEVTQGNNNEICELTEEDDELYDMGQNSQIEKDYQLILSAKERIKDVRDYYQNEVKRLEERLKKMGDKNNNNNNNNIGCGLHNTSSYSDHSHNSSRGKSRKSSSSKKNKIKIIKEKITTLDTSLLQKEKCYKETIEFLLQKLQHNSPNNIDSSLLNEVNDFLSSQETPNQFQQNPFNIPSQGITSPIGNGITPTMQMQPNMAPMPLELHKEMQTPPNPITNSLDIRPHFFKAPSSGKKQNIEAIFINELNNFKKEEATYKFEIPAKYQMTYYVRCLRQKEVKGIIIKFYENSVIDVIYRNYIQRIFPDGYEIWFYPNGDIKQCFPNKRLFFYYNKNKSCEFRYLDEGYIVNKFPNGQYEKHYFDNSKNVRFTDGSYLIMKRNLGQLLELPNKKYIVQDQKGNIIKKDV